MDQWLHENSGPWLSEYGDSHRNAANKLLHWICVPVIVVSLVGLLWSLPVPQALRAVSPLLNWGTLAAGRGRAVLLRDVVVARARHGAVRWRGALCDRLACRHLPWPLWIVCLALFVVAWIGQFIGHHYEGKRPSFFKDLQFLMIGPLWLLSFVYRKLRIPY